LSEELNAVGVVAHFYFGALLFGQLSTPIVFNVKGRLNTTEMYSVSASQISCFLMLSFCNFDMAGVELSSDPCPDSQNKINCWN